MSLKQKISLTGYRLLSILQLLMQGPASKEDICSHVAMQEDLPNISLDTMRLDINTLEAAGLVINTKYLDGEYKYVINWSPISILMTKQELRALNELKFALFEICDYRYIMALRKLFGKIAKFFKDQDDAYELLNFKYFSNIDPVLLKTLGEHCKNEDEIELVYNSPKNGKKNFRAKCIDVEYNKNNNKLYLWCQSEAHKDLSYLRVEKIEKILDVRKKGEIEKSTQQTCRYRVRQNSGYQTARGERVVRIDKEFIEVEAEILTEFHFVQRVLSLGESCFWVEDEKLRKKILEKLVNTRSIYQ